MLKIPGYIPNHLGDICTIGTFKISIILGKDFFDLSFVFGGFDDQVVDKF